VACTLTSTVPVPAGDMAVIDVSELTTKLVVDVPPKNTSVAFVNPVPVIVTDVPPAPDPDVGEIAVSVGAATMLSVNAAEVDPKLPLESPL
jgi:hypothetical protein